MRYETHTVRVGERVGDIDWSYDFKGHIAVTYTGRDIDERVEQMKSRLLEIECAYKAGEEILATTYGGWPRIGYGKVIDVGMYDGWPYWKPVPSVQTLGPLGAEWHSFSMITDTMRRP